MALSFSHKEAKELLRRLDDIQRQQDELLRLPAQFSADAQKQTRSMLGYHAFDNLVQDEVLRGRDTADGLRGADTLVADIVRLQRLLPLERECRATANDHFANMKPLKAQLSACTGGLRRLFASSAKKQDGEQAFAALQDMLGGAAVSRLAAMTQEAGTIKEMTPAAAWQTWNGDRGAFYETARQTLAGVADSGSVSAFDVLLRELLTVSQPVRQAETVLEDDKAAVTAAGDRLAEREALRILQGVPVEELNRDKGGFRVKTLRDSGYETLADVMTATPQQLAAVRGISAESAAEIKQIATARLQQSRASVAIRLSFDDQNSDATALVCAVYRYLQHCDSLSELTRLQARYGAAVSRAEETLRRVGNGALWLFTADEERRGTSDAYRFLKELLQGEYGQTLRRLSAVQSTVNAAPAQVWQDFAQNNVRYFTAIETIAPGLLGSGSAEYGLPEDLAHAVQQEPVDTRGLRCELRRYQEWGVKYVLHQKRVLLGDEMGLGKTVQAIAAMVSLRNAGCSRFAVVCPASVLSNWCREIIKHSDLTVVTVHGSTRQKALQEWLRQGGVAVTTYETTARIDLPEDCSIDMMVVDEAHYIKNAEARRSINVKKLCQQAQRLLFMTGTAIENRVDEMIALVSVLQPEIAQRIKGMAFMSSAPQFREAVAPVYYRRRREDVLTELPDKLESMEWCTLGREEEQLYEQAVLTQKYADARRVSWAVDDLSQSSKANRLCELLEEAREEGRKTIVFSFFLDTISKISQLLGDRCVGPINGSVSPQRRQELVDAFNSAPSGAVLTAQIQSGGTGLNIQAASVVVLCEPQFKPSIENQAISRAYRMGQARSVLVYRLLCENTVDEKITELLREKQAVFDAFADKSTVADETMELDETSFGDIMQSERERIEEKYKAAEEPAPDAVESSAQPHTAP